MHNIYISGNTFPCKEEIKHLKPDTEKFKRQWSFNRTVKCWHLKVADEHMTEDFKKVLQHFTSRNNLKLEILKEFKPKIKPLSDYEDPDEFFELFHQRNSRRYL
jgi:hypothetical protein